jgi:preprotein translocase subunit SecG
MGSTFVGFSVNRALPMINIVISLLTFVLIILSLFMVLVILMQRANSNAGMGSAFGGGVTESAFGADTTNVLTKATKWSATVFFIIALVLYLLYMSKDAASSRPVDADLPDIPVATAPAEQTTTEGAGAATASDAEELMEQMAAAAQEVVDEESAAAAEDGAAAEDAGDAAGTDDPQP